MTASTKHRVSAILLSITLGLAGLVSAQESKSAYDIPEVKASCFDEKSLGMMEFERRKMADHLAAYVVNHLAKKVIEGDRHATQLAEKLNGLALHLDLRNRTAMVADFQIRRSIEPKTVEEEYKPTVLAAYLVTRADALSRSPSEDNTKLAGYLYAVAVDLDPENETAVYQLLMWQKSGNAINWAPIVGS